MAANKHEGKHEGEEEEHEEGHDSPQEAPIDRNTEQHLQDEGRSKHHLNIYNRTDDDTRGVEEKEEGGSTSAVSTKSEELRSRSQSELLQQLSEVGRLRELSVNSGQLVQDGTVQRHTGDLTLCTAAAVPADLQQLVLLALPLPHVLVESDSHSLRLGAAP